MGTKDLVKVSLMLAITLVFQIYFRQFGQLVVGMLVNMSLAITVIYTRKSGGAIVGLMTPLVAYMLGIVKVIQLVPLIVVGNIVYVVIFGIIVSRNKKSWVNGLGVVLAAGAKFMFLFLGARWMLPIILEQVPPPIYVTFGIIQLYTALAGGALALIVAMAIPERLMSDK